MLETVFTYNPWPTREKIQDLADKLGVSENKVHNWFTLERLRSKQKTTSVMFLQSEYFVL